MAHNYSHSFDTDYRVRTVHTSTCGTLTVDTNGQLTYNDQLVTTNEARQIYGLEKLDRKESPKSILAALRSETEEELQETITKIREYLP